MEVIVLIFNSYFMRGIFKRFVKKCPNDQQSLDINLTTEQIEDCLDFNDVPTSVVSVRNVDVRSLSSLPANDEFDLEQQIKAGVKPEFIDPHGMLGGQNVDVSHDFEKLVSLVEKDSTDSNEVV